MNENDSEGLALLTGETAEEYFGTTIAAGDGHIVVGNPGNSNTDRQVYFYSFNDSRWIRQDNGISTFPSGEWGYHVAINGDFAAATSPNYHSGLFGDLLGQVIVFHHENDRWNRILINQDLHDTLSALHPNDHYRSVAVDSARILVGVQSSNSTAGWGVLYGIDGTMIRTFPDSIPADGEYGQSVAMDNDTIFITAPNYDANDSGRGAVYIYNYSGESWGETILTAPQAYPAANFGYSLALTNDILAVGSPDNDILGKNSAGAVYIFHKTEGSWQFAQLLTTAEPQQWDYFGISLAMTPTRLLVGAPADSLVMHNVRPGTVHPFYFHDNNWQPQDPIYLAAGEISDRFGSSLGMTAETMIIAAPGYGNGIVAVIPVIPALVRNTGATADEDGDTMITAANLLSVSETLGASELLYRITGTPGHGTLTINNTILDANDTFTQEQINSNLVSYHHDGSETIGDTCRFSLEDAVGTRFTEKEFILTIDPQNDPPEELILANTAIDENQPAGTVIGTFTTLDKDLNDSHIFSLTAGDGSAGNAFFTIAGDSLITAAVFDHESSAVLSIRAAVADKAAAVLEKIFQITVADRNEPPVDFTLDNYTITENAPPGTVIGQFGVNDSDNGDHHVFSLRPGEGDVDNQFFTVNAANLQAAAPFDFENRTTYAVRVGVEDDAANVLEKIIDLTVLDVNEPPSTVFLDKNSIAENLPVLSPVGNLTAEDQDINDRHTFTLVSGPGDNDNTSFVIVENQLLINTVGDFEVRNLYTVRIQANDSQEVAAGQFLITITDEDEPTATLFEDDFSADKGWQGFVPGVWERAPAMAGGGLTNGNPDPDTDHTQGNDNFLAGVNIGGDYPTNDSSAFYLTSPVIDCRGYEKIKIQFYRWLNSFDEYSFESTHTIEVFDGETWQRVFWLVNKRISDADWQLRRYDVSAYAAHNENFQVRFLFKYDTGNLYGPHSGWNIDDFAVEAFAGPANPVVDPDFEAWNGAAWKVQFSGSNTAGLVQFHNWQTSMDSSLYLFTSGGGDLAAGAFREYYQNVDLSGIGAFLFDLFFETGDHIAAQVLVNDTVVWSRSAAGEYLDQAVDVSACDNDTRIALRLAVIAGGSQVPAERIHFDNLRVRADFPNTAPFISRNKTASVLEGNSLIINDSLLSANDNEDDDESLFFHLAGLPVSGVLALGNDSLAVNDSFSQQQLKQGFFTYGHDGGESAADSFSFRVIDAHGAESAETDFLLTIIPQNDPPAMSGIPPAEAVTGRFYHFTPLATDPDANDNLSFSIANKPAWLNFDNDSGGLTGTPAPGDNQVFAGITITVTDQGGLFSTLGPFDLKVYLQGDINDSGKLDLADAVLLLRILTGQPISSPVYTVADADADSHLGTAEIISILRRIADQ